MKNSVLSLLLLVFVTNVSGQNVVTNPRIAEPRPMPESVVDVFGIHGNLSNGNPVNLLALRHVGGYDQIFVYDILSGTILANEVHAVESGSPLMSVAFGTYNTFGLGIGGASPGTITAACTKYTCTGPGDCILTIDYVGVGGELWVSQSTLSPGASKRVYGPPALSSGCTGACTDAKCK